MDNDALGNVPKGIEMLLWRAAADADFRVQLFELRADAASQIGIMLESVEVDMLNAVPLEQLQAMVAQSWRTGPTTKQTNISRVRASRGVRPGF